jgi:hypothetical protein
VSAVNEVVGQEVIVETYDGDQMAVIAERDGNRLTLRPREGVLPVEHVSRVTMIRRGQGALEGFVIGLAGGALIGGAIGFASGEDDCANEGHCWFTLTARDKAGVLGTLLGLLGGGIGGIAGQARGSRYVYSFRDHQVTAKGPPGSVGGVTITF